MAIASNRTSTMFVHPPAPRGGGQIRIAGRSSLRVPVTASNRTRRARAIAASARPAGNRAGALNFSLGGFLKGLGNAALDGLTGIIPGTLDDRALDTLRGLGGGGTSGIRMSACPDGYSFDSTLQTCVPGGFGAKIQQMLPGGATGTIADSYGEAVVGGFGVPALVPAVVGTIRRRNGSEGPILRCPRGLVLGRDNLCYPKAVLPARSKYRKHRRRKTCGPVSAKDMRAIRAAGRAKDKVAELAKDVGLHVRKRK